MHSPGNIKIVLSDMLYGDFTQTSVASLKSWQGWSLMGQVHVHIHTKNPTIFRQELGIFDQNKEICIAQKLTELVEWI